MIKYRIKLGILVFSGWVWWYGGIFIWIQGFLKKFYKAVFFFVWYVEKIVKVFYKFSYFKCFFKIRGYQVYDWLWYVI